MGPSDLVDEACDSELLRVSEPVVSTTRPAETSSPLDALAARKVQILCCSNVATLTALVVLAVMHSAANGGVATVVTPSAMSGANRIDEALTANRAATTEPLPPRHLPVFAARTFGVVWRLPNAYTFNYTAFIDSFFTPEQEKWLEHYKHPPSKKVRQKNG